MAAEMKKNRFSRHLGFFEKLFSTKFASRPNECMNVGWQNWCFLTKMGSLGKVVKEIFHYPNLRSCLF
jgi:hypothetical protein